MRVDPDRYSEINSSIQQSEQQLQNAMSQLSSGKRVAKPSDDPLAFAQNVRSTAASASVDTFTRSADAVLSQTQMADAALSSVVTSLTQAIGIGTQAGDATSAAERDSLAQQVEGLRSEVLSQANLTSNGAALFAGTSNVKTPFVEDPTSSTGVVYQGNSGINQAQVGNTLSVSVNQPGDSVFMSSTGNVMGALQQMISAISSGSSSELAGADSALTTAINHVSSIRAAYGTTVNELNAQNTFLSQESVSLTTQQASLMDIDTAAAATNLSQAETQNSAVLAAAAKILPQSLLQYLHG